jgi:hypothetical protein
MSEALEKVDCLLAVVFRKLCYEVRDVFGGVPRIVAATGDSSWPIGDRPKNTIGLDKPVQLSSGKPNAASCFAITSILKVSECPNEVAQIVIGQSLQLLWVKFIVQHKLCCEPSKATFTWHS